MSWTRISASPTLGMRAAWGRGYIEEKEILKRIAKAEKKLKNISGEDAESHHILAELSLSLHRDYDKVRFHQDRAYALNPNDPRIVSQRGEMLI